jgi:DNA-binding IscR family transcriptional regulator
MRISKRGEYALRALIDLGIAQQVGRSMLNRPVQKERSTSQKLSEYANGSFIARENNLG